jgi:probable HAF family extracellular repeat protein
MRHPGLRELATAGTVVLALAGGPASAGPAVTGAGDGGGDAITVVELPRLGRGYAIAVDVNERGDVTGSATVPGADPQGRVAHVVSWHDGALTDLMPTPLPTPGMPNGPTGTAAAITDDGRVVGTVSSGELATGEPTSDAVTWHDGGVVNLSAASSTTDVAVDANTRGQVLYNEDGRAVVWRAGRYTRSPLVAGGLAMAGVDINAAGLVVGTAGPPDGPSQAYAWAPGRPPVALGTLGGPSSRALAVNDRGQVLGSSTLASGERRLFLWQRGRLTDLGTLGGAEAFTDLPDPAGLRGRTRNLLNDRGDVVGVSHTATGAEHGFLWRDGRMVDLDTADRRSFPTAVNERRQVVGTADDPVDGIVPFLWQGGDWVNLFEAAPPPTPVAYYAGAADINDRGDIIGYNVHPFEAFALLWHAPPR